MGNCQSPSRSPLTSLVSVLLVEGSHAVLTLGDTFSIIDVGIVFTACIVSIFSVFPPIQNEAKKRAAPAKASDMSEVLSPCNKGQLTVVWLQSLVLPVCKRTTSYRYHPCPSFGAKPKERLDPGM